MSELNKSLEERIQTIERRKKERTKRKSKKLVSIPKKARKRKRPTKPRGPLKRTPRTYDEAKALYGTVWYKEWREKVFERDKHTCQMCGQKGGRLECHHIRPKYKHPSLVLEVKNGITLCHFCHQDRVTRYEEHFYFIFDRIIKLNTQEET